MLRKPGYVVALCLLSLALVAPFIFQGPLAWTAGLVYIAYDTCLLGFVSFAVARILRRETRDTRSRPVSIAVLIPARNEGAAIPECIAALRAQVELPEVIHVIDDGSTDDSFQRISALYGTDPRIKIWRKPHTGKADSLNQVLPQVKEEVVVTLDADTILSPDAIREVRRAFGSCPELAAAGGTLVPYCRRGGWIARALEFYQKFEYVRAFLARRAWMEVDALLLVSGAFAAYRTECLKCVQGFDVTSLVEDYAIIHQLHRYRYEHGHNWKIEVLPRARARTDCPGSLPSFLKQRRRWFAGFLQTHFRSKEMIGNRQYGNVGRIILPIKSIDTLQPLYGVVAFLTLIGLAWSHRSLDPLLVRIIVAKLCLDLFFHFWSLRLYSRWLCTPLSASTWLSAVLVTLTEPFTFQLLRHAGAVWGWSAAFRARDDWAPQFAAPANPVL